MNVEMSLNNIQSQRTAMTRRCALILLVLVVGGGTRDTGAARTTPDYRYFRALSVDLLGRPPTRAEISEFENPSFDIPTWIDAHLSGATYTERLRRIYMDQLRFALSPTMTYELPGILLQRARLAGPAGPVDVYFRYGQRRTTPELDGQLCFTQAESGVQVPSSGTALGTPTAIPQALFDARTVAVKPWWLYADYHATAPKDRAGPEWATRFPRFSLFLSLFVDADGRTPTTTVRVCKEEAQTAELGRIVTTGRVVRKTDPLPLGRLTRLPVDTPFAKANPGKSVACTSAIAIQSSSECGCGVGLERCLPSLPDGFDVPIATPLGEDSPFFSSPRPAMAWLREWWAEEAERFLDRILGEDHDVRELVTSRGTMINGPLAQFYRFFAAATCCGEGPELGYAQPEPLFDPAAVPRTMLPQDAAKWTWVPDRGPHAAGVLTMPIFLLKYGSRRARAHVLYNTFLCRDFVSGTGDLAASTEPDLTKRAGCATCHHKLEPMSAYFARVAESDWTYLPAAQFPVSSQRCANGDKSRSGGACRMYYDPDFTTADHATLRGAYSSPAHADAGPSGLGAELADAPDFAPCVVRTVAQSLLGRQLEPDDDAWRTRLVETFTAGGFRMKPLVRAILVSPQYRANDRKSEAAP